MLMEKSHCTLFGGAMEELSMRIGLQNLIVIKRLSFIDLCHMGKIEQRFGYMEVVLNERFHSITIPPSHATTASCVHITASESHSCVAYSS